MVVEIISIHREKRKKTEFKWFFPTPGGYAFVQNSIFYKKFPSKIFHKIAKILNLSPKTEFKRFSLTPGGDPGVTYFFRIQFYTKNFLAKFFIKVHRFRLIHQKLSSNGTFRTLVVTHLFKIQFPTKNFLAKFFIRVHRFRLLH